MAPLMFLMTSLIITVISDATFDGIDTIRFDDGYVPLFGDSNVVKSRDGRSVKLLLNRWSGSGFISSDFYDHGFFSAFIKLPSEYTAGVVVAFYTSNGDIFEKTHDELDFEFLGNIKGKPWRVQTNIYGNGSTSRGREARYLLPFDPTDEAHRYSILWTANTIVFYIDDTPIREVIRTAAMGGDYPSKPMSLYATIWDGSTWATSGGKYKANYKYAPFVSEFSNLVLRGCRTSPLRTHLRTDEECDVADDFAAITAAKRAAMRRFRAKYMTYSVCYDTLRYPVPFPDCDVVPSEQDKFLKTGHAKVKARRDRGRRGVVRQRRSGGEMV